MYQGISLVGFWFLRRTAHLGPMKSLVSNEFFYESHDNNDGCFLAKIPVSMCPSALKGQHCEVRVSVHFLSMGMLSVHLVGMRLGISGVALSKEQFNLQVPLLRMSMCPSVYKILVSVKVLAGVLSHI